MRIGQGFEILGTFLFKKILLRRIESNQNDFFQIFVVSLGSNQIFDWECVCKALKIQCLVVDISVADVKTRDNTLVFLCILSSFAVSHACSYRFVPLFRFT